MQDGYLFNCKKGHSDLDPICTGPAAGTVPNTISSGNAPYNIDPAVVKAQFAALDRMIASVANRVELKAAHAKLNYPESRHDFTREVEERTGAHNKLRHTQKKIWKQKFFSAIVWHRVKNWLDKQCDADLWDKFYEESTAQQLRGVSDWAPIDFLLNAHKQPCACLARMSDQEREQRAALFEEDKYRQDLQDRPNSIEHGIYSEEEVRERVRTSTTFENLKRVLKLLNVHAHTCTADGRRDIIAALGEWTFKEGTETGTSGRERNLNATSKDGKTGKTHLLEALLSPYFSLNMSEHLIHTPQNSKFGHEGASREKATR